MLTFKIFTSQAWNYTEAMAFVALVLALVPLQKSPIDFKIFQWKYPLQNENGLALSKMKFQAWQVYDYAK